jgi:6,7-dimethyl-8-ribityllumazine synthase
MASLKGVSLDRRLDGKERRVGIVHTQWNSEIVGALVAGARAELETNGVKPENVVVLSVSSAAGGCRCSARAP